MRINENGRVTESRKIASERKASYRKKSPVPIAVGVMQLLARVVFRILYITRTFSYRKQ